MVKRIYQKMLEQYKLAYVMAEIRGDEFAPMHPIPFLIFATIAAASLVAFIYAVANGWYSGGYSAC